MLSKAKYFLKNLLILSILNLRWLIHHKKILKNNFFNKTENLIVSLTSYPPRFFTLDLTIKSLLLQSHPADKIILWISHEDLEYLPPKISSLQPYGLTIHPCENFRSYNKLIHALKEFPQSQIITADDDIYYWSNWLADLVKTSKNNPEQIICHRMHQITLSKEALPLPYEQWNHCYKSSRATELNFPTGCGGVLYPPNVFSPAVFDRDVFLKICPTADDVWFYWMARLAGTSFKRTKTRQQIHCWQGSQAIGLMHTNIDEGRNDIQIQAMIQHYSWHSPLLTAKSNNGKLGD